MLDLPDTKPFLERLFRPATHVCNRRGMQPNTLTVMSLSASSLAGVLVLEFPAATWPLLTVLAAMLARLALNHMDGILAREHGMKTPWGSLLNEIATPAEDMVLYLPLAARPEMPSALIVLAVMLGVLVEVAGLSALTLGSARRFDGPMAKVPRGTFFGVLAVAAVLGLAGPWVQPALLIALGLLVVTAGNRLSRAVREVSP